MRKRLAIVIVLALFASFLLIRSRNNHSITPKAETPSDPALTEVSAFNGQKTEPTNARPSIQLKHPASQFNNKQKSEFTENFEKKYWPAIIKWSNAYAGHVPLTPQDVTADKLAETVGNSATYHEYVFVVNGITLGVRDANGTVSVDYFNVPEQTRKMTLVPDGSEAPRLTTPVSKEDILRMVHDDVGTEFSQKDVRVRPTGISGSLNGGATVEVGGDPNNFASWRLSLIFATDGTLAYYLKGPEGLE